LAGRFRQFRATSSREQWDCRRAARSGTHVQPTPQTVARKRAMIDPSLLDDPRFTKVICGRLKALAN
jgi:hypothetical protein